MPARRKFLVLRSRRSRRLEGRTRSIQRGFALAAILIASLAAAPALACDLAKAPTTRWSVREDHGSAWLVTPCGERFFAIGVNVLDGGLSGAGLDRPHYDWHRFAPSLAAWTEATRQRLGAWGFNSAGAWSLAPQQLALPTAINLEIGRLARFHWFDPFDPAAAARLDAEARRLTAPYRDTPYRIGYFSDNEVGWWSGALFLFFSEKPAENYTKQRWVGLLRRLYHDDWRRFTGDFAPPSGVNSWAALLSAQAPTRLRPGGEGSRAVERWTAAVAEHYYALTAAALKRADPQALFLGDRLPIYYDPAAVRAEARHVDAIAVNYNVDSPEGWIAPYFFDGLRALSGGKPVLVSEWFYAARENRSGNRDNGHLMTVATQAERAQGAAAAAANFARVPELLGLDWFQYYDYPQGGRADREDYDFGLVDIDDRPYERLTTALGAANRRLPAIHAVAHARARPARAGFVVPKAMIDPTHASLIDWPKPASLLPPLRAGRGEAAFGEAYLTWSDQGLAVATIGQDYYDRELLAYEGNFPLGEAYRLEFDLDAGAGPRRFTLYFIPPGPAKDSPPMSVRLCAGAAKEHRGNRCPAVEGASALYFGADQPRVVAEALIPWSALGLAGPPTARRLRFEVSATSWFRARWMSLSGLPPEAGSADPERWATVRLGDRRGADATQ
ncbi:MAG TPA: hypothetical protein VN832_11655 [Stellaceae bacterium]|nr:hypothetical protein [Stellaceae bacterium]